MGQGAVFADKNHTDLVNGVAAGSAIVAGNGIRVTTEYTGTPNARYRIDLSKEIGDIVIPPGGGGGGSDAEKSTIAIYEKAIWDALEDPQDPIVAVYDATQDPQPRANYYTATVYVRQPSEIVVDPETMSFVAAGESKIFSVAILPSGQAWKAEVLGSGFSIDKTSGAGDDTITVTASENSFKFPRGGKITVTSGKASANVVLDQIGVTIPESIIGTVAGGSLLYWQDGDLHMPIEGVVSDPETPTGSSAENASPQTISYSYTSYLIYSVVDQGGGVFDYIYYRIA